MYSDFGFPADFHKNTGILVFVDRFSKMVHLIAVPESINASACACVFIDTIFHLHGLPRDVVSNRDSRFTAAFWQSVFKTLGTRLKMSTYDHPETDGQTERANRVLEEIVRGYVHSFTNWSEYQWLNFLSTIRCTHRRRILHSLRIDCVIHAFPPF